MLRCDLADLHRSNLESHGWNYLSSSQSVSAKSEWEAMHVDRATRMQASSSVPSESQSDPRLDQSEAAISFPVRSRALSATRSLTEILLDCI